MVGLPNGVGHRVEDSAAPDALADGRAGFAERLLAGLQRFQLGLNCALEIVGRQVVPVGVGGRGEAARHPNALVLEGANHLPERGVLAAHEGHILIGQSVESANVGGEEAWMTLRRTVLSLHGTDQRNPPVVAHPIMSLEIKEDLASSPQECVCRFMPYPKQMVEPMREELTQLGVEELRTADEVDAAFDEAQDETMLLVINSVCGCAAGNARPAVAKAQEATDQQPDRYVTVFAGQDLEATERAREYLAGIPPSSPFFALFRDGEPVYLVERKHIEGRNANVIASDLVEAFETYCTDEDPPADAPTRPAVTESGGGNGLPSSFQSIT